MNEPVAFKVGFNDPDEEYPWLTPTTYVNREDAQAIIDNRVKMGGRPWQLFGVVPLDPK